MDRKTKKLLKAFALHVAGATGPQHGDGLYRRAAVHRCADLWLTDMGAINASVVTDDDGRACVEAYKEALAKQLTNGDYYAAKLLAIRAFPLTKRYDETRDLRDILAGIDAEAREKGADPHNRKYVNYYELQEAVKRFGDRCRLMIDRMVYGQCFDYIGESVPVYQAGDLEFVFILALLLDDFRVILVNFLDSVDAFTSESARTYSNHMTVTYFF